MSRNNTGNPIGSKAFADFEDNVKNLDEAVNTADPQWVDRLGRFRLPLMEQERQFVSDQERRDGEFQADQADREQEFRTFIASSGYQFAGDYAAGIEITQYNQLVRDENGEFWRVSAQVDLPYVTTGAGIPEGGALVPAGDAVLRQDLANPEIGAAVVARTSVTVGSLSELASLPRHKRLVAALRAEGRSGVFYWESSNLTTEVAADVYQSVYVASGEDPTGAIGAWVQGGGGLFEPLTLPVGPSCRYTTVSDALEFLSNFHPAKKNLEVELQQQSGFVFSEQVRRTGERLSWIRISSQDEKVVIRRSALSVRYDRWFYAYVFERCEAPIIDTLYEMDQTGDASLRTGLYLKQTTCKVVDGKGFTSSGERNADVTKCSTLDASGGIFINAGTVGVRCATASSAFLQFADLSGSGTGLSVGSAGTVAGSSLVADGCSVGISVQGGCTVDVTNAKARGCTVTGLSVERACVVEVQGADFGGGLSDGIRATGGAIVRVSMGNISGCARYGIAAERGARVVADGATITGNLINVRATLSAEVNADLADLTGATSASSVFCSDGATVSISQASFRVGANDAPTDISLTRGGRVIANDVVSGGFPQTPNIVTPLGLIQNNSTVSTSMGQVNIPAGATSATVSHGVSVAVVLSEIRVTPGNDDAGMSNFWIGNLTPTSFDILLPATQPGTAAFYWEVTKTR